MIDVLKEAGGSWWQRLKEGRQAGIDAHNQEKAEIQRRKEEKKKF